MLLFFFFFWNRFFVSFEGGIQPQKTGWYNFSLTAADGARVYLAGEKIIDTWNAYGLATQQSRLLFLNSSLYYTFEVQLFDLSQAIATLWYLFAFFFFFSFPRFFTP